MQNVARLTLRPARASDLDEVLDVFDEAASWLSGLGLTQWPRQFESAWVLPPMGAGETWLADIEGIPAATITLDWSDHRLGPLARPVTVVFQDGVQAAMVDGHRAGCYGWRY